MLGSHSQAEVVGWTPDKGSIQNERQRQKNKAPALVATGKYVAVLFASEEQQYGSLQLAQESAGCVCRNAGQSRVEWMQKYALYLHEWRKGMACIHFRPAQCCCSTHCCNKWHGCLQISSTAH